jgi:hypothetical protein
VFGGVAGANVALYLSNWGGNAPCGVSAPHDSFNGDQRCLLLTHCPPERHQDRQLAFVDRVLAPIKAQRQLRDFVVVESENRRFLANMTHKFVRHKYHHWTNYVSSNEKETLHIALLV